MTLDSKLGSAISDLAKGELGRRVTLATEREDKEGRNVTGRQLLKVVYDFYKTDEFVGIVYDISDLTQIKIKGDNPGWRQLQAFRDTWDETLAGMDKEPGNDILEALFKQQVRHCPALAHDIGIYDRAEKGTTERSYKFLYEAVQRLLSRKQSEVNRSDIQRTRLEGTRPSEAEGKRGRTKERSAAPAPHKKDRKKTPRGNSGSRAGGKGRKATPPNQRRLSGKQKGICYSWKNNGKCEKHERGECGYAHPEENRGRSRSSSSASSKSSGRKSSKGKRKGGGKGKKGRDKSPKDKKSVHCHFYLRAVCTKGDKCEFKHDPEELEKTKGKSSDFAYGRTVALRSMKAMKLKLIAPLPSRILS